MSKFIRLLLICGVVFLQRAAAQECGQRQLDPDAAAFLKIIGYQDLSIDELRQIPIQQLKLAGAPVFPYPSSDVKRIKITRDSIPVLVFNSSTTQKRPIIVNYHGGGFISPLIPALEQPIWQDSKTYDAVIFAVDYRVAPEHRFPAAVEDSYNAFKWISEHGSEFGGDLNRLVLMGNSAGANLVAVVAQQAKKDGIANRVKLQIMNGLPGDLSPQNMETSKSYQENATGYFQTKAACYYSVELYAPDTYKNPQVSPLLANDFKGLPPALIINAEFDPLRDDGVKYAGKLRASGVAVTEKCFAGQIHCLIGTMPDSKVAQEFAAIVRKAMYESF